MSEKVICNICKIVDYKNVCLDTKTTDLLDTVIQI